MRADQRAEFPVRQTESIQGQIPGISFLPREQRYSMLGVRLTLAVLATGSAGAVGYEAMKLFSGSNSNAEAAALVCDQKKHYGYTIVLRRAPYYDLGGKVGIFDKGVDPWLEIPVLGGGVKAVDSSTGEVLNENNFVLQRPNVPASLFQPKDGEQNVAWSVLRWEGKCDTDTSRNTPSGKSRVIPGKEIKIVTTQDESNQTFDWVAAASGVDSVWTGRAYKTVRHFLEDYEKHSKQARDLTPETLEKFRASYKEAATRTVVPTTVVTETPRSARTLVAQPTPVEFLTPVAALFATQQAYSAATAEARNTQVQATIMAVNTQIGQSQARIEATAVAREAAVSTREVSIHATGTALTEAKTPLPAPIVTARARATEAVNAQATAAKGLEATSTAVATSAALGKGEGGSTFLLTGALQWLGYIADTSARLLDQVTEPDVQFPARALVDAAGLPLVLALLAPLRKVQRIRHVGTPGSYILGTGLYPIRYPVARWWLHRRAVAAAVAVGNPAPVFQRPSFAII